MRGSHYNCSESSIYERLIDFTNLYRQILKIQNLPPVFAFLLLTLSRIHHYPTCLSVRSFIYDSSGFMHSVCIAVVMIQLQSFIGMRRLLKRVQNEVISCLDYYFTRTLPDEVDTLNLYSDGCGGQNKNRFVIMYLYSLVKLGRFKKIKHVFLIRGHSFLPCDRDFGVIEQKKRKKRACICTQGMDDPHRNCSEKKAFRCCWSRQSGQSFLSRNLDPLSHFQLLLHTHRYYL